MKPPPSSLRFLLASGLSFLVNFGLTVFIRELLGAPAEAAFAIALATVFVMNFFVLRYYVYDGQDSPWRRQFFQFAGSTAAFRGLDYLAFLVLHTWLGADYRVAVIGILSISAALKYVWYKYIFEFRPRQD